MVKADERTGLLFPSLRRLALSDVDEETLRQLVEHGESLYVDRKLRPPPSPGFGAAAAAFANTLGGFILLGISDDKEVIGWEKSERLDLQSHIGAVLRSQVDPLPPFVADMRELNGKPVGVIRVFESADSPHIVRGTGAINVRTSKGKEPVPVDDHATVMSLARRGEEAAAEAQTRLMRTPAARRALGIPISQAPRPRKGCKFIASASPLTVTPALSEWPLTRRAGECCLKAVEKLLPPIGPHGINYGRTGPVPESFGRAIAMRVEQGKGHGWEDEALAVADSNGVIGVMVDRGAHDGDRPTILVDAVLEDDLQPIVESLAALLAEAEVVGRVAIDLWITVGPGGHIHGYSTPRDDGAIHVSREITAPADPDELEDLAAQWHREFQRTIGIVKFEDGEGEAP